MNKQQSRECQFDATTEKLAIEKHYVSQVEAFCEGRNSAKTSLEILARASEQASFPLGIPVEFINNPEPRAMAKWLNAELKDRSDTLRQAIAAVKARGDWPL